MPDPFFPPTFSRRTVLRLLPGAAMSAPVCAAERIPVRVVSEPWAWLIYAGANGQALGPIAHFIGRMNEVQRQYRFDLQIVPRLRVNLMFQQQQADVFPLRTLAWTEPSLRLQATRTLLKTGDLYIARADNAYGGMGIFDQPAKRRLAGVRGYHYGVFGNNPDEKFIRANFNVELLPTNEAVIEFVRRGRAEVGIVPEAIMVQAMRDPQRAAELILSQKYDSQVELSHLVRDGGPISVEAMNAIVEQLEGSGDLARLRAALTLKH